jgi:hypothetical protein
LERRNTATASTATTAATIQSILRVRLVIRVETAVDSDRGPNHQHIEVLENRAPRPFGRNFLPEIDSKVIDNHAGALRGPGQSRRSDESIFAGFQVRVGRELVRIGPNPFGSKK